MCRCKAFHPNRFVFGNIHFIGKDLCTSVNEEGLPGGLLMETFNHVCCEGLPDFVGILSEEVADFFERKVRQSELILDIERRNGAIKVQLCNALDTYDTDTVRALRRVRKIDMAEDVEKTFHGCLGNTIKFVNEADNSVVFLEILLTV